MDRKLVWTEKASSHIEAIVRYIARRDPKAAARIGLGIYDRAQILLEHPEAGRILDELRQGGWRKLIFRRWKIVYTIREESSLSGESGQQRWAKPIWKRRFR
jgi:plasmid stabilization system protein ParE